MRRVELDHHGVKLMSPMNFSGRFVGGDLLQPPKECPEPCKFSNDRLIGIGDFSAMDTRHHIHVEPYPFDAEHLSDLSSAARPENDFHVIPDVDYSVVHLLKSFRKSHLTCAYTSIRMKRAIANHKAAFEFHIGRESTARNRPMNKYTSSQKGAPALSPRYPCLATKPPIPWQERGQSTTGSPSNGIGQMATALSESPRWPKCQS